MTVDIGNLAVRGQILRAGDPGYEDARAIFNGMIDRRPAMLVRVSDAADVAETLRFAREQKLEVSVRGGGHGVAGRALGGDLVIDLSALRAVTVDPGSRTAVVQGGATWGEVDQATQAHGLAVPGGRITHTGVAGLTLGGGEGWLSVKHGLACDNLLAVELVTADGRLLRVDDESEPELMWALRGGGGNFGVVVSFTFRLHPVGPMIVGGMIGYRVSDAPAVLEVLARLNAEGSEDLGAAAVFMAAPPAPFVPPELVGQHILAVAPTWFGEPEAGAQAVAPLREEVEPLFDAVGPMPYVALQAMLDAGSPPGLRNRWGSGFVETITPELIAASQEPLPGPMSHLIILPLPEAVRRLPELQGAFPGRMGGRWLVHPVATWMDPSGDERNLAWVSRMNAAVRPTGTYLNLEAPDDDRVRWAMGETRYRRLQRVKAVWDPDDVFRHCAHVTPWDGS
ncbi:FAD-binding oxidoreductase [Nonomuraea sp. NPDC050536]|uniref:FAD-binding oxidoreductase n=1 Tax=Nonomuraea sp. NPDC050536 TaxID=3364366 RepID=UPI0037C6A8E3